MMPHWLKYASLTRCFSRVENGNSVERFACFTDPQSAFYAPSLGHPTDVIACWEFFKDGTPTWDRAAMSPLERQAAESVQLPDNKPGQGASPKVSRELFAILCYEDGAKIVRCNSSYDEKKYYFDTALTEAKWTVEEVPPAGPPAERLVAIELEKRKKEQWMIRCNGPNPNNHRDFDPGWGPAANYTTWAPVFLVPSDTGCIMCPRTVWCNCTESTILVEIVSTLIKPFFAHDGTGASNHGATNQRALRISTLWQLFQGDASLPSSWDIVFDAGCGRGTLSVGSIMATGAATIGVEFNLMVAIAAQNVVEVVWTVAQMVTGLVNPYQAVTAFGDIQDISYDVHSLQKMFPPETKFEPNTVAHVFVSNKTMGDELTGNHGAKLAEAHANKLPCGKGPQPNQTKLVIYSMRMLNALEETNYERLNKLVLPLVCSWTQNGNFSAEFIWHVYFLSLGAPPNSGGAGGGASASTRQKRLRDEETTQSNRGGRKTS